jgi:catechol 2,3-dioxygenase-like lactoylglutathione lyase family enzyme
MINGAHVIIYSKDADADRAFFKDVLGFHHVDAGHGWLIFALPPAEVACHPGDENDQHELYLMCEDLTQTIAALDAKGIHCSEVHEPPWGVLPILLSRGRKLGLYQPRHPTAAGACTGQKPDREGEGGIKTEYRARWRLGIAALRPASDTAFVSAAILCNLFPMNWRDNPSTIR